MRVRYKFTRLHQVYYIPQADPGCSVGGIKHDASQLVLSHKCIVWTSRQGFLLGEGGGGQI